MLQTANPLVSPALAWCRQPALLTAANSRLVVSWAACEDDVRQAQRLRYQIFAGEMGANIPSAASGSQAIEAIDSDRFDPFCDHLLVRAVSLDDEAEDLLVGTYRVLAPGAARQAGGLYMDTEFDLLPLNGLRAQAVELGRSCVHPAWRSGGVIMALWSALCDYMFLHQLQTMIGCASVSLNDGGQTAARLWRRLRSTHLVDSSLQVTPRHAFVPALCDYSGALPETVATVGTPPLIKGYLRCGARLLGPPALDSAFNTADLPLMLRLEDLSPRYRDHFFGK